MLRNWNRTSDRYPPEGQKVVVLNGDLEQELVFERGMWWLPDRSMYVYFVPSLWRHNDGEVCGG